MGNALKNIGIALLLILSQLALAQTKEPYSLVKLLPKTAGDTGKVNLFNKIADAYTDGGKYDKAAIYGRQGLALALKLKWDKGVMALTYSLGFAHRQNADFDTSLTYFKQSLVIAERLNNISYKKKLYKYIEIDYGDRDDRKDQLSYVLRGLTYYKESDTTAEHILLLTHAGSCYEGFSDYKNAFIFLLKAKKLADESKNIHSHALCDFVLGDLYTDLHEYDKALPCKINALRYYEKVKHTRVVMSLVEKISVIYDLMNDNNNTLLYQERALSMADQLHDENVKGMVLNNMGQMYQRKKDYTRAYLLVKETLQLKEYRERHRLYSLISMGSFLCDFPDSALKRLGVKPGEKYGKAINYLNSAAQLAYKYKDIDALQQSYEGLSRVYQRVKDYPKALQAYKQYIVFRDSGYSEGKEKDFVKKELQYEYTRKEDSLKYQHGLTATKLKAKQAESYYFIAGLVLMAVLIFFISANFLNQKKSNKLITTANHQLKEQQEEITAQRDQLAETITTLRTTQQQLIQAEKLASLGELTSGIAHEIQNPLNFVNNFSEVSTELLNELQNGPFNQLPEKDKQYADELINDLVQNLQKIHTHGKRADGIVKSMLEHSKPGSTAKEPTDINKLAEEYLHAAYLGFRAKDKTFSAKLTTEFDTGLPLTDVVAKDIGRVLVNLFNNAFYALQQKQKTAGPDFAPELITTVYAENGHAVIKIRDNGTGIPEHIKDKIMQPFFTTKPTGEGTGLGLSLSYDIIVKGHGGDLKVETSEGQFTEFIILLPC